jgi:hypothetical protein
MELKDEDIWAIAIGMDLTGIKRHFWSTQIDVGLRSKAEQRGRLDPKEVN